MITADGRRLVGATLIGTLYLFCGFVDCFASLPASPTLRSRNALRPLSGHFVGIEPLPESGTIDRKQALSQGWSAAVQLLTIGAVATGATPPARAGVAEFLFPRQDESAAASLVDVGGFDKEITFEDFERSLLKGEVKRCEFFGSNFDKAVLQLADGSKALIGEGYPQERAFSNDSPMKVVGMLRNAGVPFTTPFKTNTYARPRSYKTNETLEAENRQRTEDATLERLMSD